MKSEKYYVFLIASIFLLSIFSTPAINASSNAESFSKEVDFKLSKSISKSVSPKTFESPTNVSKFLD